MEKKNAALRREDQSLELAARPTTDEAQHRLIMPELLRTTGITDAGRVVCIESATDTFLGSEPNS